MKLKIFTALIMSAPVLLFSYAGYLEMTKSKGNSDESEIFKVLEYIESQHDRMTSYVAPDEDDRIIIDGVNTQFPVNQYMLSLVPKEPLPENQPLPMENMVLLRSNMRGFWATYEIRDSKLYLVKVESLVRADNQKQLAYNAEDIDSLPPIPNDRPTLVKLKKLSPQEAFCFLPFRSISNAKKYPILADWISQSIKISYDPTHPNIGVPTQDFSRQPDRRGNCTYLLSIKNGIVENHPSIKPYLKGKDSENPFLFKYDLKNSYRSPEDIIRTASPLKDDYSTWIDMKTISKAIYIFTDDEYEKAISGKTYTTRGIVNIWRDKEGNVRELLEIHQPNSKDYPYSNVQLRFAESHNRDEIAKLDGKAVEVEMFFSDYNWALRNLKSIRTLSDNESIHNKNYAPVLPDREKEKRRREYFLKERPDWRENSRTK